jgi:hypothetical protein
MNAVKTSSNQGKHVVASLFMAALAFPFLHCDEALPTREEPRKFLKASLNVRPLVVHVVVDSSAGPQYPERVSGTNGSLELSLVSYYGEVLQDHARIQGTIDVWMASRPEVRATVTIDEADVDYPVFDPDGVLTLIPGDSVHAAKQWNHLATNGRGFYRYGPMTPGYDPIERRSFYQSAPIRFNASATFQVFENVQAEKTEVYEFSLIYRLYVIYPP